MNQKNLCLLLLLSIFLQGCMSFDKSLSNPKQLNEENLNSLNGRYEVLYIDEYDSITKAYNRKNSTYHNFLAQVDRKYKEDINDFEAVNLENYHIEINLISPKKLNISYIKNGIIIREETLKIKLKKNGYLYLKKKKWKIMGVPYIFGNIDLTKTRFTIDKNENLILDVSNVKTGAGLLIIELHYDKDKYRKRLKRVE